MLAASLRPAFGPQAAARPLRQRRRPVAAAAGPGDQLGQGAPLPPQAPSRVSAVPGADEDREVMHAAFMSAYGQSHHGPRIKGMQEFAGALLARQRIPSGAYSDPLGHIFDEFDTDKSGALTAKEVAAALRSRNVEITDEQAAEFIGGVDMGRHTVTRAEFRDLIMHMAAADLHTRRSQHKQEQPDGGADWVMSSWEQDEEIVQKLKNWTDSLMMGRTHQ